MLLYLLYLISHQLTLTIGALSTVKLPTTKGLTSLFSCRLFFPLQTAYRKKVFKSCLRMFNFAEEHTETDKRFCSKFQKDLSYFPKISLKCVYRSGYTAAKHPIWRCIWEQFKECASTEHNHKGQKVHTTGGCHRSAGDRREWGCQP